MEQFRSDLNYFFHITSQVKDYNLNKKIIFRLTNSESITKSKTEGYITKYEDKFYMRSHNFLGTLCLRQVSINLSHKKYNCDFLFINCRDYSVYVVEIDGGIHNELSQRKKDHERMLLLNRLGISVIRIENHAVYNENTYRKLKDLFDQYEDAQQGDAPEPATNVFLATPTSIPPAR